MHLGTFEAHLWSIYINQSRESIPRLQPLLTATEQNRANGYQSTQSRDTFILSRGYLRIILSKYLQLQPTELEFATTSKGKPYLVTDSTLQFNLSHSRDLILYAITHNRAVGLDVEYLRELPNAVKIAQRFFSPEEAELLSNFPQNKQSLAFFQGWTSKEAFLKATGEGIAGNLGRVKVELNPSLPPRLLPDGSPWLLRKVIPAPGYLAILATNAKINCRMFNIKDLHDFYAQNH